MMIHDCAMLVGAVSPLREASRAEQNSRSRTSTGAYWLGPRK